MPDGSRGTVTVAEERYADVIDEIKPLLVAHYEEIASFKDAIPLDPDYEAYQRLEAEGRTFIIASRRDGRLVGYSIFFLVRHPHYKSTLMALNDIVYVDPEERGGRVGIALFRVSERVARERGAVTISWHIKAAHDFSLILERMGYARTEVMMAKLLRED